MKIIVHTLSTSLRKRVINCVLIVLRGGLELKVHVIDITIDYYGFKEFDIIAQGQKLMGRKT